MGYVPDLLADNSVLECAGLGFGEEESHLLMKSLKVRFNRYATLIEAGAEVRAAERSLVGEDTGECEGLLRG